VVHVRAGSVVADARGAASSYDLTVIAAGEAFVATAAKFRAAEAIYNPPINQSPRQAVHRRSFWSARLM
jgi:hypothetical protein